MSAENSQLILRTYLDAIGIVGHNVHSAEDKAGTLLVVEIPRSNGGKIGVLYGRTGRNLSLLKSLLWIIAPLENVKPILVIKLTE